MAAKVFISYRRDDARYQARMIHSAFTQAIPRENVFMDIDSIPLGVDFRKVLRSWIEQCDVLLALIGPGWIGATDPKTGEQRLKNPADFVRIEIGEALAREIPVVPILLDGAPMPEVELLPEDLKELVYRHAEFLEHGRFGDDVARLIKKLKLEQTAVQDPSEGLHNIASSNTSSRSNSKRLAQVNLLIESFFQPIKGRLQKDNAIWERTRRDKSTPNTLEYKVARAVEDVVIKNHDEIVAIIENWGHLVDQDVELRTILDAYLEHVVVFKSIRAAGDDWSYPDVLGARWPESFFPLIDQRLQALLAERDLLKAAG